MFTKVIWATDGSEHADRAMPLAVQVAKTDGAEHGVKTSIHVVAGLGNRIGDRIAEIAQDAGADLIVVGTRGHGALGSFVLGGVTQRLLHVSWCPVLSVPPGVATETQESPEPAVTAR
jgi:nucleotide-binding universal stress UspA family protein